MLINNISVILVIKHSNLLHINISHQNSSVIIKVKLTEKNTSNFINNHYNDIIMGAMASQITSLAIVYSTVYAGADQRKHQSSASLAFVWGIHRWPVNSPHKWPVTRKMFPFDDVIMISMFGAKPLPDPNADLLSNRPPGKLQWSYNQIKQNFCQENAFKNVVCIMAAILFGIQYVTAVVLLIKLCQLIEFSL